MIDRRTFIGASAAALLVKSLAAAAQPGARTFTIGTLSLIGSGTASLGAVLATHLSAHGYVVGKNIVIVERSADGVAERLPALAAELVQLKVDVIVAGPVAAIRAAHEATKSIPIVMSFSGDDPVKNGFVASLAHPGGNVTGVTAQGRDLASKSMDVLLDVLPGLTRVGVLINPLRLEHEEYFRAMQVGKPTGAKLQPVEGRAADRFESAFAAMTKGNAEAVIILGDVAFTRESKRLAELSIEHRLPSIYIFRQYVTFGGLLAYGPDEAELIGLAASYVVRIFNGEKPADLPVEQPSRFHLAINLKTARTLGVAIPPSMLVRADEIVQ